MHESQDFKADTFDILDALTSSRTSASTPAGGDHRPATGGRAMIDPDAHGLR